MAIDLDHSFSTDKPIDESFAAITDLERVVPAVEGGSVIERTGPGLGQGRDPHEDGRDVDEDDRHRRGRRAGRRGPSRRAARQVEGGRRPGPRQRGRHLPAQRRRRHDPHPRADHRARPRRWARAWWSACSMRSSPTSRASSARSRADGERRDATRSARARCRSTAGPRSRRIPIAPPFAATARTTTSACKCGNVLAEAMHAMQMTKKVRVRCGRCSTVNVAVTDE